MEKKFIYIISDVHMEFYYYQETIPENIDLLVIAGDLINVGNREEAVYAFLFLEALKEDKNIKEIIWLLGNHDVCVTKDLEHYRLQYPNIQFIIKDEFIWDEVKFFLTGYSAFIQSKWVNYYITRYEERKAMIPATIPDIIISHCPPSHKEFSYIADSRADIGSTELRRYIEENNIKFCFSGHLHLEYSANQDGYVYINGCHCYNVTTKGQLISLKDKNIQLENYKPSISYRVYSKCKKNGVPLDHIEFMKFIQLWEFNISISKEFYQIKWESSGIKFSNLPDYELAKVKDFFLKYYGDSSNIQSSMLYKFN